MGIRYIGRTSNFSGKTLWELLGNLKNFGVGRLVKRNIFEKYQEPCFFRILKVDALDTEEGEARKVRAYVERVFRGKRYSEVEEIDAVSYKPDYRLVPKNEEKTLWEKVAATVHKEKLIPESIPFPPLLNHILVEEMPIEAKADAQLKLKLIIKQGPDRNYRMCEKGEAPNVDMDKTQYPHLYENTGVKG